MEVIGTPDSDYLDGWENTFGNIVYIKWGVTNYGHWLDMVVTLVE